MGENREPKLTYRLIPCPEYDVAGMEQWLSDMAEQGLLLQKDGFFFGIATFEKTVPQWVKYRVLPASKNTSFFASDNGEPDEEEIELSKKFGWEYVVKRGEFYIYRTTDREARELHTDKEVQALAMKGMRKRQWENLLILLPLDLIYLWIVYGNKLFVSMIHIGTPIYLLMALALFLMIGTTVVRAVKLLRLRKRMLSGENVSGQHWKSNAWKYHSGNTVRRCAYVLGILLLLITWSKSVSYENYIPLDEYTGNPPFATMEDFLPGGEIELMNMRVGNMNSVRVWSDILSEVNYEWDETGTVTHPDGRTLSGGLEVIYHETKKDWIAAKMVKEYLAKGKTEKEFEKLELELEGPDDVLAFTSIAHFPSVILRKDNKVIYARFYISGKESVRLELSEWAGVLAECLSD